MTNRLLGTDSGGQRATCSRASASRAIRRARPTRSRSAAIQVPGIGDRGPYDRFYLRNPGFNNHDLSVFKNFPLPGGNASRYLQFRLEMFNVFNHTQFSGVNRTTNLTNGAGQTGAAILNDYTNLAITNNLRPAGATPAPRHLLRRVQRRAGPAHHPGGREAVLLSGSTSDTRGLVMFGKNHGGCGRRGGRGDGDRRDRHAPSAGAGSGTAGARGGGSGPPPRGQREHDAAAVGERDPAEPELLRDRSALHARRAPGLGDDADRGDARPRPGRAAGRRSAACISRGAC